MVGSSFLMPETDRLLFAISALTRALASAKFLASNAGFGKLICPGTFSLFLFLPESLLAECGESIVCLFEVKFLFVSKMDISIFAY
jgi:hypothetical protein